MNLKKIEEYVSTNRYADNLTERQLKNARAKSIKEIVSRWERQENQPIPHRLVITVEWKKSRMWGANPHATARAYYDNHSCNTFTATAGGCGYDKLSTVVADVMNQSLGGVLVYAMKQFKKGKVKQPYAIGWYNQDIFPASFSGGVGIGCYDGRDFRDGKLGMTFKRIAIMDTSDVFEITVKQKLITAWEKRHAK